MLDFTGCEEFSAEVSFFSEDPDLQGKDPTDLSNTEAVRSDSNLLDTEGETGRVDCTGEMLWTHNNLSRLYTEGNTFDIAVDKNNQLILTLQDGRVDSPAIRYIGL